MGTKRKQNSAKFKTADFDLLAFIVAVRFSRKSDQSSRIFIWLNCTKQPASWSCLRLSVRTVECCPVGGFEERTQDLLIVL